jgi:uncharacterized protein (DUF488 family)
VAFGGTVTAVSATIFTVGHSNKPLADFLGLLRAHGIRRVLDVRRFPGSRRWPHFGSARLAKSMAEEGIGYVGLPGLGGRRQPREDSPHTAWRVEAFRGYADFMDTPEFATGLAEAERLARETPPGVRGTARTPAYASLMCAEALPWRCHRSLIADALVVRGWDVRDVISEGEARIHRLPGFARVEEGRLIYDGVAESPGRLDL